MRDALDDLLGRMHVEGSWYAALKALGPWAVTFETAPLARLVIVVEGTCLLTSSDVEAPMELSAGDCIVVQPGIGFSLQDRLGRPTMHCEAVFARATGREATVGESGPVTAIQSGRFSFDAAAAEPLMPLLPPILRIRLDEERSAAVRATLDLMAAESDGDGMGAGSIIDRLADVLFIQVLRAWCAADDGPGAGWIAALRVPPLAVALRALHSDLARPWTVADLAREAAMSRSAFAALFRDVVGEPPLSYLTSWRVYRAKALLKETRHSLSEIAVSVGYDSDTALSRAFRRFEPLPPGAWRRAQTGGPRP
ncbi:AraC family transcriptional regulator [Streptosporangium sp. V21-05]|uniref:AraC family transcriptional regulator n=1 Tax=Streptosporangium sp. V21-05 TaxID=3446115 RepID=UPI003F530091